MPAPKRSRTCSARGYSQDCESATDTDLSLAFAWRFWHLLRQDGRAGIVLPRGILAGRAAAQWRTTILNDGAFDEVTSLSNSRNWMFEDVHPQYTIGLVSVIKGQAHVGHVIMRGPYFSLAEYQHGWASRPIGFSQVTLQAGPTAQRFPLLPHADSLDVFLKLRSHPRLDTPVGDWQFVPLRELHTTDNKPMFDFDLAHPGGDLPVLTGASFNLWNPDFGDPYAYAKTTEVIPWLQERRRRQIRLTSSAFYGMSARVGCRSVHAALSASADRVPRCSKSHRFPDGHLFVGARQRHSRPHVAYLLRRQGEWAD